ncbi:hypothetical protein N9N07_01675 [Pseudomonadales bacterium]|nr:hypothetical protein [Pseudomonadales bacterium]
MILNKPLEFLFVVLLLSFDSLLKIDLGALYLQLGLFFVIIFYALRFSLQSSTRSSAVRLICQDRSLILFISLALVHIAVAIEISIFIKLYSYIIIFTILYLYVGAVNLSQINLNIISKIALVVISSAGIIQMSLLSMGDYQIQLRGVTEFYYQKNGDMAVRMRGLFLEPNWFGLVVFGWLYIFIRSVKKFFVSDFLVIILSLICLLLSANRLIFFFISLLVFSYVFKPVTNFLKNNLILLILFLASLLFIFFTFSGGIEGDRSASARFFSAFNVLNYMADAPIFNLIFGHGFSNWGWYSNEYSLSVSNYMADQDLTRRDNSEIYVVFFEMGLVGLLYFAYELKFLSMKKGDNLDKVYIACFYLASLFYPIFTFLIYLPMLFIVRYRLVHEVKWE